MPEQTVKAPDGTIHTFPAEATPQQMQSALSEYTGKQKLIQTSLKQHTVLDPNSGPTIGDSAIDILRPLLGNIAGNSLAAGTALISKNPIATGSADIAGYMGVDAALQYLKSKSQRPDSTSEALTEGGKQAIVNLVGGKLIGGLFRGIKTFINEVSPPLDFYKFMPTTSQALEKYGFGMLAGGARFIEDFGATGTKAVALDRAGGAGLNQTLGFSNFLNHRYYSTNIDLNKLAKKIQETLGDAFEPVENDALKYKSWGKGFNPNTANPNIIDPTYQLKKEVLDFVSPSSNQNLFEPIDKILYNKDKISKVLSVGQSIGSGTNVRGDLQAYQFMRMIGDATTGDVKNYLGSGQTVTGAVRIDPGKITPVWNKLENQDALKELWGAQGMKNVDDFIHTLMITQNTERAYPIAKPLWLMRGGIGLGTGLVTDVVSGNFKLGAAAGFMGMFIPLATVGKMLTNTGNARLLTEIAQGMKVPTKGAKILFDALQGATLATIDKDGKKHWCTLEKDPNTGDLKFKDY